MRYPLKIGDDGSVTNLPGYETFPDVGGKIMGANQIKLPDDLTAWRRFFYFVNLTQDCLGNASFFFNPSPFSNPTKFKLKIYLFVKRITQKSGGSFLCWRKGDIDFGSYSSLSRLDNISFRINCIFFLDRSEVPVSPILGARLWHWVMYHRRRTTFL